MKILIAVPCMDAINVNFVRCLEALERPAHTAVAFVEGSLVYAAREDLSKAAIEAAADYVLWLDSDMTFAPDLLSRLLDDIETTENADAVAGLFFRRRPPYTPAIWRTIRMGATPEERQTVEYPDYPRESLFDIDACGMAAVLVRTSAIKRVFERYKTCFIPMAQYGEDVSFCLRVKQTGGRILCDSRAKVGHVGAQIINEQYYDAYRAQQGQANNT